MTGEDSDRTDGKTRSSTAFSVGLALQDVIELTCIFALALALRLLYNFSFVHVNNFASCDAFEYINNGQAFLQLLTQPASFWQKSFACLCGHAAAADWEQVRVALAPLKDFNISGPVFPAFLALIAALSGGSVSNVHYLWPALVSGNAFVSALTCVLIALITFEAFDRRSARIAGLLSVFYPAFIVNSGRLYSETFAAFLLAALSYITLRGFRERGCNFVLTFASGFLAACLQLTRSVMVVLTLCLVPLTAMQQKGLRRVTFLLPFALGFLLVALPWMGFQKLSSGSTSLVVDRVGHYNFFIGNNVDTQGWLSYPYPDGRNVETASFPELAASAIKKSPYRWFRLMLDKPLRLFAFPWNDFRTPIGPCEFKTQVDLHKAIVLLCILGIALTLLMSVNESPDRRRLYCRLYLFLLLAFHFIYCLFITVPRYNLTAMPLIIVFAAPGAGVFIQLWRDPGRRRLAVLLCAALILLSGVINGNLVPFFVFAGLPPEASWVLQAIMRVLSVLAALSVVVVVLQIMQGHRRVALAVACLIALSALPFVVIPLRVNGRSLEWYQNLTRESPPLRQVVRLPLSACRRSNSGLYLLLDTGEVRQRADGLELTVNGQKLHGPVLPSMAFAENFDRFLPLEPKTVQGEGERIWDTLTNSAACSNLDLRQWSVVPLPGSIVAEALARAESRHSDFATLEVLLSNLSVKALRIYGSYDTRGRERIMPSLDLYSWEKVFYGVENPEGLCDTRYDIKVPAATLVATGEDLSDLPGKQNGVLNMALLVAPPVSGVNSGVVHSGRPGENEIQPGGLKLIARSYLQPATVNKTSGADPCVDLSGLSCDNDALFLLCLHGRCRMMSGNACPAAELKTEYLSKNAGSYTYKSAWSPRHLAASSQWRDFEIVVPVKPRVGDAAAVKAIAGLRVVSPDSQYLNIPGSFTGEAEFAALVLDVYLLPSNPIGLGHQVY